MNITALRPRFVRYLEPVAEVFVRLKITPNQISLLALLAGMVCAILFFQREFFWGSLALLVRSLTGSLTSMWTPLP